MNQHENEFSKWGFAKAFVRPALLVFLVPFLSLMFFLHAQNVFDTQARDATLQQIRADTTLTEIQRADAIRLFSSVPFSTLILDKTFAANIEKDALFNYATFRWMIRLSVLSIVAGVAVFALAGVCVLFSLRSQYAQYVSLTVGWHVLRIYGALQTIALGILVVSLSYWVTALWFGYYFVKLIMLAYVLAGLGAFLVIKAIFTNPKNEFVVEGAIVERETSTPLWNELKLICEKVGTTPPDHIITGIDDNFFVTEQPVTVNDQKYHGKTLFVSLPLLKQLNAAEADSILAHEMAHFSGQDTLYTKKTAPLLLRFHNYLNVLREGGITIPVYYFMLCFRMLFELTIQKISRDREFRADRIAAETTSPGHFTGAMLRIVAYSKFRQSVESDLFKQERAMESADVSDRIEKGFPAYAVAFAADPEIGLAATAHPFDSHPPTTERLNALGVKLCVEESQAILATQGDGGWHRYIPDADELERQQWRAYEERFRRIHEESLPYRFLPETAEEQAIVERDFPAIQIVGNEGTLSIDYEKIGLSGWSIAIHYKEIISCVNNNGESLDIRYKRIADNTRSIQLKKYTKAQQQQLLETFQRYYGRYLAAAEYQRQNKKETETSNIGLSPRAPD